MCTKLIKPSVPTPPHLRTLKLSPVDQVQYPTKTAVVLYYSADGSTGSAEEVERRRMDRLETSLSETLIRFYPLAGRYIKDGNWVDCNDEGVEFFVAKVKGCQLSEFLSRRDEMIDQLSHLAGGEFTSPVVSIQICMFDCGGLVMGFRLSHYLFDAFSAISFFTSWATASRQGMDDHEIWPTFGVANPILAGAANGLRLPKMKPMPRLMGTDNGVTKRIVFDGAEISALRAISHDPSFPRQPSRVEVVTALIWRARMRVSRAKHGRLRTSLAAHTINLRPRIVPPLPRWSFGNLQSRVTTKFMAAADDDRLPELKDLVGLLIDSFTKSKETIVRREDVFASSLQERNELHEAAEKGEVDVYKFTSWCRFPLYQVDFGWGKPVWLSRIHSALEAATLLDTEGGDGIEAWLSFNKKDMPLFLQDKDILAFTSNPRSKI